MEQENASISIVEEQESCNSRLYHNHHKEKAKAGENEGQIVAQQEMKRLSNTDVKRNIKNERP